jgi:Zn-dependent protease with chaperone function
MMVPPLDPPSQAAPSRPRPARERLGPLPYQSQILDYLRTEERDLWTWFSSSRARSEHGESVRLDLLKSTYRLEPAAHAELYVRAQEARAALGLEIPVTLYQAQVSTGLNASLAYIPGEAHLVLSGPVLSAVAPSELLSILAHELSHYLLWEREDGAYLVARQVLQAMAGHRQAQPSHARSARLFHLYEEVYADRGSLLVSGDVQVTVAGLVKLETGLASVSGESFLRQAEEIFSRERVKTQGTSHPESFIRARALKLWSDGGPAAEAPIAEMLEGPLELDELDLLGQRKLTRLSRRLLGDLLAPAWFQTEPVLGHARLFFRDFALTGMPDEEPLAKEDFPTKDRGLQDYLCYLLLDFAAVDPDLEESPLAAAFGLGERLGLADRLEEIAGKELGLSRKELAKIRKERGRILEEAGRQGDREAR